MVTLHDLCHCSINNPKLARNDQFTLMTISGHKTTSVFRRYNVFTDDELQDVKWINHENSVSVWVSITPRKRVKLGEIRWCQIFWKDSKYIWNFLISLWKMRNWQVSWEGVNGARNGNRTRDPELGKLVLYQLSYSRSKRFERVFILNHVSEKKQPFESL